MAPKGPSAIKTHFTSILLVQAVIYTLIWLWDEFIAVYVSLIFPSMLLIMVLFARIADWIEPSNISRWYYGLMIASILTPIVIGIIFFIINEGRIGWLDL
jgi:hypothetical protein